MEALDKNIPMFVQSLGDKQLIEAHGFKNIKALTPEGVEFNGVTLYKTPTQHGKREIVKAQWATSNIPYDAMGVVLKTYGEKTLYLVGDSTMCYEVTSSIDTYKPDVIIVNACGATLLRGEPQKILMDVEDVQKLRLYTDKPIIASCMDAVSHATVSRDELKALNLPNLLVPNDGETLEF